MPLHGRPRAPPNGHHPAITSSAAPHRPIVDPPPGHRPWPPARPRLNPVLCQNPRTCDDLAFRAVRTLCGIVDHAAEDLPALDRTVISTAWRARVRWSCCRAWCGRGRSSAGRTRPALRRCFPVGTVTGTPLWRTASSRAGRSRTRSPRIHIARVNAFRVLIKR